MKEGWHGDDYLVLLNDQDASLASERYGISTPLPGYGVIGLRGWDDFIVRDGSGKVFTVPTVPCTPSYLASYELPSPDDELKPNERFEAKVKWYITPLVFGGDPSLGENLTWITHEEHAKAVRYWNARYRDLVSLGS